MLLRTTATPAVLAPQAHMAALKEMADMTWSVKRAGWEPMPEVIPVDLERLPATASLDEIGTVTGTGDRARRWVPVQAGDSLTVSQPKITVSVVRCFHTIEDVGYVFSEMNTRLQGIDSAAEAEYQEIMKAIEGGDKKSGRQIGQMRKSGRLKDNVVQLPRVAFLCDTTVQVFGACHACRAGEACPFGQASYTAPCPRAAEISGQLDLIFQCSTIIVECSFVAVGMDEVKAEAEAMGRGHVAWSQLRPIVESHSDIDFILVHFSERYTDAELRCFFTTASSSGTFPPNVLLWLDEGLTRATEL